MKRGQVISGKVTKVTFPNKGIMETAEGDKLRIKGERPGQTVTARVKKSSHDKAEAMLISVDEPSPLELKESACPHFGICGGCTYQSLPYEVQLDLKAGMVKDLLLPVVGEDCLNSTFEGIKASPKQFCYRNKMEFSFGDEMKDGPLTLGMHKKGSFYDVVTVDQCQIIDEDLRLVLKLTLDYFTRAGVPYYRKGNHVGYLRFLLVRKAAKTEEILIDLITSTQNEAFDEEALLSDWVKTLTECSDFNGKIAGILHTFDDREADVVSDEGTTVLYGQDFFTEELLGLSFKITPFSFFQTNSLGAEVLYETARDFIMNPASLPEGGVAEVSSTPASLSEGGVARSATEGVTGSFSEVFDLYSGTGTIAQIIAPAAGHVTGVEIIEEAVEAAKVNAGLNGLTNCDFIAGDVLKVLDDIKEKPDYIILDPPRDGINPKALEKIIDYGVESLVYISCKPTSLARDLERFLYRGYEVKRVACVDMFPGTYHVETCVLLSKLHVDKHIDLEITTDEFDLTSVESKATYEKIRNYVAENNDGMKVTNLYIAQVKAKHGIIERENYNLPKSENSRQPQCPDDKAKAIEEALRYFQMI